VSAIGLNSGASTTITQAGPVVNLQAAAPYQTWDHTANYTLTQGTLNFATTDATSAFAMLGNATDRYLQISGGTRRAAGAHWRPRIFGSVDCGDFH
jgi:hypothetical protein